jgi:hypothetical protein
LTSLDKRTLLWKRIVELRGVFTTALAGAGAELSPTCKLNIEQAAEAVAVAELARGRYMRNGAGDLDELVRVERRADALVKRLSLPAERPKPSPVSVAGILARRKPEG